MTRKERKGENEKEVRSLEQEDEGSGSRKERKKYDNRSVEERRKKSTKTDRLDKAKEGSMDDAPWIVYRSIRSSSQYQREVSSSLHFSVLKKSCFLR